MDFDKHRDHAVHTLYNYLLGWYIVENIPDVWGAFKDIFEGAFEIELFANENECEFYKKHKEFILKPNKLNVDDFFVDLALVNHFGDVWPIASLLHDVGYILEGSLSPATPKIEHERVTNGTKVLHDYFNHWLWRYTKVDFRAAIEIAKSVGCIVPDFTTSKSIPSLSDRLRDVGNLENIRNKANKKADPLNPKDRGGYALNLEAFELWALFYKKYIIKNNVDLILIEEDTKSRLELILIEEDIKNNVELVLIEEDIENNVDLVLIKKDIKNNMELILQEVREEYENDIWDGSVLSKINLNHGVCGGLILLQASTFWYEFMWGLESQYYNDYIKNEQKSSELVSEETFHNIKKEINREKIPAHIWLRKDGFNYTDWIKDLWATAAVTIHDYVTKKTWGQKFNDKEKEKEELKIDLQTDPLAYLAVLVDIVQEWDRYTVLGESAFSENTLLQSYETYLKSSPLRLVFPKDDKKGYKKEYKKNISDALTRILKDWDHYVKIEDSN